VPISLLIILITFIVFAGIHTLLASHRLKNALFHRFPILAVYYRAFYNVIALVTLGGWVWLVVHFLPQAQSVLYRWPSSLIYIGYSLQVIGLLGALSTFRTINGVSFLGISQILNYWRYGEQPTQLDETKQQQLIEEGLYRCIRHPLYTMSFLLLWGNPEVSYFWIVVASCSTVYFIVGSFWEEQRLTKLFGSDYKQYRQRTGLFLPPMRCLKKLFSKRD
jgi:protein-S-isoprenylcysteine O-methyltransferase Ste14